MEGESFFLTVAQVGVTLAGFASLISAFRRRDQPLGESEITGRSLIVELGLAGTFFALLPFPIDSILTEFGRVGVWRIASAVLLVFLIGWGFINLQRFFRAARVSGHRSTVNLFYALLIVVNIALIVNILLLGYAAVYMTGILWMLLAAGVQFMIFVYTYARQE